MKFNARQYSLASFSVLIALSGTAHSATTYMEARNDAMGGTGVASSHYGTAALANPALLTHFGASDDFSLILPSVGAQVPGLSRRKTRLPERKVPPGLAGKRPEGKGSPLFNRYVIWLRLAIICLMANPSPVTAALLLRPVTVLPARFSKIRMQLPPLSCRYWAIAVSVPVKIKASVRVAGLTMPQVPAWPAPVLARCSMSPRK